MPNHEYTFEIDGRVAERVKELRCGERMHSWRRIAEIISEEFPQLGVNHGNQLDGKELCDDVMYWYGETDADGWN